MPLAFGADPNRLYYASNQGRDTYGIYALDLAAKSSAVVWEEPGVDLVDPDAMYDASALVFDRDGVLKGVRRDREGLQTHWDDPALITIQALLDGKFPARNVQIQQWDQSRNRILVRISSAQASGVYGVYDLAKDSLLGVVPASPWLPSGGLLGAEHLEIPAPSGERIHARLTQAGETPLSPPALLVYLHDLGEYAKSGFDSTSQALAATGFAVLEVDYHGSGGHGGKFIADIGAEPDRLPLEDVRAAISWVVANRRLDRDKVVLFGRMFGGYLALRALQQFPDEFQAAAVIDAPIDPAKAYAVSTTSADSIVRQPPSLAWRPQLLTTGIRQRVTPVNGAKIRHPVMAIYQETPNAGVYTDLGDDAQKLRSAAKSARNYDIVILTAGAEVTNRWGPREQASTYATITAFLKGSVFDGTVDIGPLRIIK